jgi:hypothetical protein
VSSTKFIRRDLNRYRKIYPYIRKSPHYAYYSDKEAIIEVGEIDFTNSSAGSYTFKETYSSVPIISAISYDSLGNNIADVNVFVTSLSTTAVTIETSQNFTGKVHFQAIWIGT